MSLNFTFSLRTSQTRREWPIGWSWATKHIVFFLNFYSFLLTFRFLKLKRSLLRVFVLFQVPVLIFILKYQIFSTLSIKFAYNFPLFLKWWSVVNCSNIDSSLLKLIVLQAPKSCKLGKFQILKRFEKFVPLTVGRNGNFCWIHPILMMYSRIVVIISIFSLF